MKYRHTRSHETDCTKRGPSVVKTVEAAVVRARTIAAPRNMQRFSRLKDLCRLRLHGLNLFLSGAYPAL
ncbi:MAG: hypothetical protein LBU25_03320 [Treponema sp.]|nr:hypothetical protein [Treponema sp.]